MRNMSSIKTAVAGAALLALPAIAAAHPGHGGATVQGLEAGFMHPMGGADHVIAMVAVGLLAAQAARRTGANKALWMLPASFIGGMAASGALGMAMGPMKAMELGIAASILTLGVLLAGAFRLPTAWAALVCGAMAIFHGYAHGAEAPASASGVAYAVGFMVATAMLHAAGIVMGIVIEKIAEKRKAELAVRVAGGLIAASVLFFA